MAIRPVIRNVVTGKPVQPTTNVRVDRVPSERGVRMSGISTDSEFRAIYKARVQVNKDELANKATEVPYSFGKNVNTTA